MSGGVNESKEPSVSELRDIIGALQMDRAIQAERDERLAERDERIERELAAMRRSGALTEANIAKLTQIVTEFVTTAKHTQNDVSRIQTVVDSVVDRVTVQEIKGQERDTKIKILMFTAGAVASSVVAWVISAIKG